MFLQECYQLLEIPMYATEKQIKKAYRTKAKQLHPDANPNEGAKLQFQQLNEAYLFILKNLNKIPKDDFVTKNEDYKKYGTSVRNKSYSKKNNGENNKYHIYKEKDEPLNRSPYDKYIFWFFLVLGINMLVYAIIDVYKTQGNDKVNYNGLFAAIPFLVILIIGWRLMKKW
jgi:hypothetical protein